MLNEYKIENFLKKNKNIIIIFFWLISSVLFYFYILNKYGEPPRYGMFDWNRYYDGAISLLNFQIPEWPSYYFLSYCLYLATSIKIFFPYFTLIVAMILNLICCFLIYKISLNLFNDIAAVICVLIFLFYPYYQMWIFFIQPVNFFSFCLILVLYSIVNYKNNLTSIIVLLLSLILVFTARPNGISEVISVYIFLIIFYFFYNKKTSFLIFVSGIPIIYLLLIFLSNSMSIMNVYDAWYLTEMKEFGYELDANLGNKNFSYCLGLSSTEILNLNQNNAPKSDLNFWVCSIIISPLDVLKIFS